MKGFHSKGHVKVVVGKNNFKNTFESTPEFRRERFRILYEDLYDDLWRYVQRRSTSTSEAQDVLSEVFLVAWRRLENVPSGSGARPWLFGVARNLLRTSWRKGKRRADLSKRLNSELLSRRSGDLQNDISDILEIIEALRFISESDQEIIRLVAWEELSHKDVSIVLGCTENAVAIRLHRARTRLVKVLQTEKKFSEVEGLGDLIERFSPETTGTS